eukprot:1696867-Prymnesium_polylepis.1
MLQHTTSASAALASPMVSALEPRSPAHVRRTTVFSHHSPLRARFSVLRPATHLPASWFVASVPQETS